MMMMIVGAIQIWRNGSIVRLKQNYNRTASVWAKAENESDLFLLHTIVNDAQYQLKSCSPTHSCLVFYGAD